MTQYPNIKEGDVLDAAEFTRTFQNLMRINLAMGKGIVSGCVISPGSRPGYVAISQGEFVGQTRDEVHRDYETFVGSSVSGYLWLQADDDLTNDPVTEIQTTDADPGAIWVCLGYVTTSPSGDVAVDMTRGRTSYGYKAAVATMQDRVDQTVATKVAPMIAAAVPNDQTDYLTGDGSKKVFSLSYKPRSQSLTIVLATKINFSFAGNVLTMASAPPAGQFEVKYTWVLSGQ